ncbi:putative E3 ubiquitin-protein ligase RHG1A [Senna tora]|uniref:RING-type E3 ubiquitin transferase n=1 Tax=Senna tora TaxID=362788 RepID=A0A834TZW4_9FABA|nr:putative E3 ubiquitin-protein ligase RHG1A [Senna tora]
MQGQRGTLGSLPETLEFDCGSTSSNASVDQQICWNNMRNPADNDIPEYLLPPGDINPSYLNSVNHEWQNSSGWSLGEPSSGNTQSEMNNNQQKRELGWSSQISAGAVAGPRLEGRHFEPTIVLSADNASSSPMYMHGSNSHLLSPNLNLNAGLVDGGSDNSQHLELPNLHKSANERIQPSIGSGPFLLPSGNNSFMVEGTDGRSGCSLDARRVSCKRKAIEGNVGPSSDSGSSSYSQHTESSTWPTLPTQDNSGSSLSRSASSEQLNARLGLGMGDEASESLPDSNVAGSTESFHRNFRLRINPSSQQDTAPPPAFPNGSVIRHSSISSSPMSHRFSPVDNSLDLRAAPAVDNIIPQSQPLVIHVPALPRNMQSIRWNGGSSSRNSHSSSSVICADRDNLPHEEASSRSISRNLLERPVFVPATDLRNLARNPTNRASSSANLSGLGNAASSSRAGSNSAINQSSSSTWVSRPNPPHYPRRLSEYVRRSLFSPPSESGGSPNPSNNYSSLRSGPSTPSEARVPASGAGSSLWMERQGDEFGIPYSLRTLAAAGEGNSSRLVSELRNVLGLMRRGGGLRFEDVMILDQSVFSGMADIHDRHRDMRLDVDNMSYEELLALEERIGNVSTGLSEDTIMKLLKLKKYSVETGSQLEAEPCCVCQEVYNDGDDIGTLDCGHDYHTDCIKQWLMHKNLCPICKTTGLAS